MRYMLLIYGDEKVWDSLTEEEGKRIGRAHEELQEELRESGELVGHTELADEDAAVVRSDGGTPKPAGGPLRCDSYVLGGYYLVDCAGLERATEIAARFGEARFAPVEVRRLSGGSSWDTGSEPK